MRIGRRCNAGLRELVKRPGLLVVAVTAPEDIKGQNWSAKHRPGEVFLLRSAAHPA